MRKRVWMIAAVLALSMLGAQTSAQSVQSLFGFIPIGAVYTMSNAADTNGF